MTTHCPVCDEPLVVFSVPEEYQPHAPEACGLAGICPTCLTVTAVSASEDVDTRDPPAFTRISTAFPESQAAAIPLSLALGLCESLALNRPAIETLLESVERAGTDPLLVIDRLLADPTVDPALDLERRRHQLEQFLF